VTTQLCAIVDQLAPCEKLTISLSFESGLSAAQPLTLMLVRGREPGPVLWVQAGLHGDEYDGIPALLRLYEQLEPEQLCGTLILAPLINYSAFFAMENGSPYDGQNLNRCFPGDAVGTFSQRYAAWLFQQIVAVADCHLDLHGGGRLLDVCSFAMMSDAEAGLGRRIRELARAAGAERLYVNQHRDRFLYAALCQAGIPALLIENGGGISWEEPAVERHGQAVRGVMAALGMLPGHQPAPGAAQEISNIMELRFPAAGLQLWHAPAGWLARRGDKLLEYAELPALTRRRIDCPADSGVVLAIHRAAAIRADDYAVMLGW